MKNLIIQYMRQTPLVGFQRQTTPFEIAYTEKNLYFTTR